MEVIKFDEAIRKCHDWLRGNVVMNLLSAGFVMNYASSPNKERDYYLFICEIQIDLGKRRHYVFQVNKDGSFRKIGVGKMDESTNTITLEEIKLEWKK